MRYLLPYFMLIFTALITAVRITERTARQIAWYVAQHITERSTARPPTPQPQPQVIRPLAHYRRPKPHRKVSHHAKPAWVSQHILRLKRHLPPGTGVRKIAATFNRLHTAPHTTPQRSHPIRVSKSYVANVLRAHQLSLQRQRTASRSHTPGISPINRTWGIDLTGKQDQQGQSHAILGILDHGSRKLLCLLITPKHSQHLAQHLQQATRQHGHPQSIRTDNEACFTSPTFSTALQSANIRHQRINLHSPWQNGRIERLFGTLKQQLNQIQIQSAQQLQSLLDQFKHWYNTVRLHQHLAYQTPQEVWQQQKQQQQQQQQAQTSVKPVTQAPPKWWKGWGGQLSGVQWSC
jgi:putative transposase